MDPLLSGDIGLAEVLIVVLKVVVAFAALMVGVMLMVWFERKLVADMQNRIGPNRAGPFGLLQTLADGIKLFFKEELTPAEADPVVYRLAPYLSLIPAFLVFTVVPVAGNFSGDNDGVVTLFGHETLMQVADPQIGILLVLAMSSVAVYGIMLAGWSSGSKYPLLGSVRATSQMVSYEAALGLSVATVLLLAGSLSTNLIVDTQAGGRWNLWMTGLVPFVVFLVAGTAELNRPPFDLVEAEQELVGGFHTEYTALRFAMFFLAEFMNTVTMSAIIVTLFFGGPAGPTFGLTGWFPDYVLGFVYFFAKLFVFLFVFVWFRATLPRLRYDQLMDLGWKLLIPLALGWFLIVAAVKVAVDSSWNVAVVVVVAIAGLFLGGALLRLASRSGRAARLEEARSTGETPNQLTGGRS
ncbi:MAG: NADH-quinone oxidoreductase subunit NuoH [Microthrixaceae bacterium]|nr:NADH-quinone oxidoreductase subunit NuoH [Microthrixaceae bacterium]MCO5318258.1 NADH-quinone oxidoreductase subunit NuoH [Microthrixaceae bacterium]